MINTIFYFPESLTFDEYINRLNSDTELGIAGRTIVFAKQLGKIYNNGKLYGTTYSEIQNLIDQNKYDDEYVRTAISNLEHDLQENSDAIDLLGQQYLAINQRISTIENNGYVSEAQMLSAIAGELDGSTQKSSVRNKVNNVAKEASAALFTEVSDQNDNITALSIVNAITSNSTAKANLASSFNSGDNVMWANVLTQADLNNSSSALYAALKSKANDSEVVKKASIIASINSSGESNVSINADKIQLNGTVIAERLMAAQAVLGGFTIQNSKLSNSAVEFNADGSGYLAAGAIHWTNDGGLDINADGLLLDVSHPSVWSQWWGNSTPQKGLAAFGVVGDYSNLKTKAYYNFDSNEYIFTSAVDDPEVNFPTDPKEATRTLANNLNGAIFNGSAYGISLLNPRQIDKRKLEYLKDQSYGASGTGLLESGFNNIHPCTTLYAKNFDRGYFYDNCTSGLEIDSNACVTGSLVVGSKIYTKGLLNVGGVPDGSEYGIYTPLDIYAGGGLNSGSPIYIVSTDINKLGIRVEGATRNSFYISADDSTLGGSYWETSRMNIASKFKVGDAFYADTNAGKVGIGTSSPSYKLDVQGQVGTTGVVTTSDETLKNKVGDVALSAEDIANAPAIKFTWKDEKKSQDVNVGTIAQYWQEVLPEAVRKDSDGKLGLNYQGTAMAAVISLAKEVVELKAKVAELESKLNS